VRFRTEFLIDTLSLRDRLKGSDDPTHSVSYLASARQADFPAGAFLWIHCSAFGVVAIVSIEALRIATLECVGALVRYRALITISFNRGAE